MSKLRTGNTAVSVQTGPDSFLSERMQHVDSHITLEFECSPEQWKLFIKSRGVEREKAMEKERTGKMRNCMSSRNDVRIYS